MHHPHIVYKYQNAMTGRMDVTTISNMELEQMSGVEKVLMHSITRLADTRADNH